MNAKIILSRFQWTVKMREGARGMAYSNSQFFFSHFRSIFTGIMSYIYRIYIFTYGWNKIDCSLKFGITQPKWPHPFCECDSCRWIDEVWKCWTKLKLLLLLFEHLYVYEHACKWKTAWHNKIGQSGPYTAQHSTEETHRMDGRTDVYHIFSRGNINVYWV